MAASGVARCDLTQAVATDDPDAEGGSSELGMMLCGRRLPENCGRPKLSRVMVAGMLKWIVIGVVVLGLLGVVFGSGDDDSEPASTKPAHSSNPSPESSSGSEGDPTIDAADCEQLAAARRAELAFGARRGVTVARTAFVAPVESGADGYLAVALHVTKAGRSADVVLAAPEANGKGLTLATGPALDYFTWGAMARNGSPVDEIRDAVEHSDAATTALACLADES